MKNLKYFDIKKISNDTADIYFYGEIVGDEWEKWSDTDTCPQDIIVVLKKTENRDLNIFINSPGGSVFAGLAIYNILKRRPEKKTVYIDGVAASIASIIAMVGDEIIMPQNSFLMIHKPFSYVSGNADDMRKMADDLDILQSSIEEVYKSKLKNIENIELIKNMMAAETWLTAKESEKYFNITVSEGNKATNKLNFDLSRYNNTPKNLIQNLAKNEDLEAERLKLELELAKILF